MLLHDSEVGEEGGSIVQGMVVRPIDLLQFGKAVKASENPWLTIDKLPSKETA